MGIRTPVNASHDKGPVPTQAAFDWFGNSIAVPSPASFQVASRHLQLGDRLTAYALFFVRFVLLCAGIPNVTTVGTSIIHLTRPVSSCLRACSFVISVQPLPSRHAALRHCHQHKALHPLELEQQPPDPTTEGLTTPTLATRTKPDDTLHSGKKSVIFRHHTMR